MAQDVGQFDVVVIGSGVAGALVSFRLARAGVKVLIVEAGGRVPEEPDRVTLRWNYATSSSKSQSSPYAGFVASQPNADKNFGRDYYVEDPTAKPSDLFTSYFERLVGGSAWHWQGISLRMLPSDFKLKSLYNHGFDWPIEYEDLEPWYCEAEKEMGVAGNDEEMGGLHGAFRSRPFPMPEIEPTYLDRQVKARLKGSTFEGIPLKVTTVPQARNSVDGYDGRPACDGHGSCIPLCPTKAKYEALFHIEKAEAAGAVVRPKSIVTRIELDDENRVSAVVYRRWDGMEESVRGRIVVLAANGIETPKLLLLSNNHRSTGVANSSGRVGQYLMDHPIKMSYALAGAPLFPFQGPPSTSSIESLRDGPFRRVRGAFRTTIRNDGWSWPTGAPRGTDLSSKGTVLDFVGSRRMFGDALKSALADHTSRQIMLNSAVEMLPDPSNRIVPSETERDAFGISRPEIHFKIDDYTRRAFLAAIGVHARIFEALEAGEFHLQADSESDAGSGHIMGTTIMGNDSRQSVVDRDCRAHDHENLFILGSSVFPTAATANPTLTIAALALRAAETIHAGLAASIALVSAEPTLVKT